MTTTPPTTTIGHSAWLRGRVAAALLVALDGAVVALAAIAGYYVRFEGLPPAAYEAGVPWAIVLGAVVYVTLFALFGLYRQVLRYVGVDTVLKLAGASLLGVALLLTADVFYNTGTVGAPRLVPVGVLLIQWLLALLGSAGVRLSVRVLAYLGSTRASTRRRVLIVGAGDAGSLLLRDIENQPDLGLHVVGFLDDDPSLRGRTIRSVPVVGTTTTIAESVKRLRAEEVLVALPAAPQDTVRRILNDAAEAGMKTRIMPRLVLDKGSVSISDLRKVEVEDLLGREPAPIDVDQVRETIAGKTVAVTGAAGSIGSELCRQILTLDPSRLVLIEQDESRLYELWLEIERVAPGVAVMHICDIRDPRKLEAVFRRERPQVVLHAAAYKHVPLMEIEPDEAVKTNVIGTRNVIEVCTAVGAERFVLISTDKAVAPQSVMGATKAIAERVMLGAARDSSTTMVAVRFGNVLGSRGSVVPIFEEQLSHGGPLTVTDPEVTRYFMTIPEAARLVLQAQAIGTSGDIFVLEMGEPVRIVDLARKMIALSGVPADIEFVGLRPAEKLHEELTQKGETLEPTGRAKVMRLSERPPLAEGFERLVEELGDHARRDDLSGLRGAMCAILPDFEECPA